MNVNNAALLRLSFVLSMGLLHGCATMDKSECLNADWHIIGLEDGDLGMQLSYLSAHREACARHGVVPDLQAYKKGRELGLKTYCTTTRAWAEGRHGKTYRGVCPAHLEQDFLRAYERGAERYRLLSAVKEAEQQLNTAKRALTESEEAARQARAARRATEKATPEQKEQWRLAIQSHRQKRVQLERDIFLAEETLFDAKDELQRHQRLLGF